jgi:hypothetical protein
MKRRKGWVEKPKDFKPEPYFPAGHAWAGQKRCQAWNGNHGRQCMKKPIKGQRVCSRCGGKSLKGVDSPRLKTGKHSKYLQTGLLSKYQSFLTDPDRLSLLDDIALFNARIAQLLEFIEAGPGLEIWFQLEQTWKRFKKANQDGDKKKLAQAASEIDLIIQEGVALWRSWEQIDNLTERKRKMIDSEVNRQAKAREVYQINEVIHILSIILEAVNSIVSDNEERKAVNAEFTTILGSFN